MKISQNYLKVKNDKDLCKYVKPSNFGSVVALPDQDEEVLRVSPVYNKDFRNGTYCSSAKEQRLEIEYSPITISYFGCTNIIFTDCIFNVLFIPESFNNSFLLKSNTFEFTALKTWF